MRPTSCDTIFNKDIVDTRLNQPGSCPWLPKIITQTGASHQFRQKRRVLWKDAYTRQNYTMETPRGIIPFKIQQGRNRRPRFLTERQASPAILSLSYQLAGMTIAALLLRSGIGPNPFSGYSQHLFGVSTMVGCTLSVRRSPTVLNGARNSNSEKAIFA